MNKKEYAKYVMNKPIEYHNSFIKDLIELCNHYHFKATLTSDTLTLKYLLKGDYNQVAINRDLLYLFEIYDLSIEVKYEN